VIDRLYAGELVVGTSTGYPPYYFTENGELSGFCVDIIRHTTRSLGLTVVFKQYPWKRMLRNGRDGQVDAVMPLFKTPAREQFLLFPDVAIAHEENSFFIHKDAPIKFSGDLHDIADYAVGVVAEYSYGSAFDKAAYLKKVIARNELNLMRMFKFRRFEVGLGNWQVVSYFARKVGGIDDLVFLEPPITRSPLYLAFSRQKGHTDLIADFSRALRRFKTTSTYRNILKRYSTGP
jgi:polar amino acid transport system substrate-binding protein